MSEQAKRPRAEDDARLTRRRFGALLGTSALAAATASCAAIAGEHDTETKILVQPGGDGTFFRWSEITLAQDVNSVDGARLQFVVLEVMDPPGTPDLSFIRRVKGEAVVGAERTTVVEKTSIPKSEPTVPLDILHKGDLRPFFADGHTIRIEWSGAIDTSYPFPPQGITVRVALRVVVE